MLLLCGLCIYRPSKSKNADMKKPPASRRFFLMEGAISPSRANCAVSRVFDQGDDQFCHQESRAAYYAYFIRFQLRRRSRRHGVKHPAHRPGRPALVDAVRRPAPGREARVPGPGGGRPRQLRSRRPRPAGRFPRPLRLLVHRLIPPTRQTTEHTEHTETKHR